MSEVNWKPVKSSSTPLYLQIVNYIRNKIMSGEWTIGTKLPSQRQLAACFEVNRSTVITALQELIAEGLLEAKTGSSTFVANNTWNVLATSSPNWPEYVQAGIHQPNRSLIQQINKAEAEPATLRLGTGELGSELIPTDEMKQMLISKQHQSLSLGYEEPKGNAQLRETLSRYLRKKGIQASPSSILIVSGGLQALQLIAWGLLRKGSVILHEAPSYLNSLSMFESVGIRGVGIPLDRHGLQMESLVRLKRQHDAALLYTIPSFHNPTGAVMSEERRKQLTEIAHRETLPLIEDDVYGDLWFEDAPPPPLKADDRGGNVLYLGSVSKALSPGLRIGWLVGPEQVIDRLADIKMQTDYGSSSLSQAVVNQWIQSGKYDDHLSQLRVSLLKRRNLTLDILRHCLSDCCTWNIPAGGFYIWLRLQKRFSARKLFQLALQKGILLNPGSVYDKMDDSHIRLSYAYPSESELVQGLQRLAQLIKEDFCQ
ncbi:PLP-dependent aminotransferase family protein [Alkalihalobacillus oceani]|uniref:MocR-like pyridoxine biosynthesis transcription factor PdxR n=1 Tax=Halalkalibacter oceani TaxID=1653776 RepID=UPI0020425651|nr:PLP-dependent aminotransferase family protein [Halalkalibacter oceani]MCM3759917.1 PLP-dependent aminotransferase family protein [Halalkalibacter oceani]